MMPTAPDPQTFDHLPEQFERFAQLRGAELATYLRDSLPRQGGRAVDLGCGTGRHIELLADRYREVLAVDLSAAMLRYAQTNRRRDNVIYQQRDLQTVDPDTDGTFDLVLSVNTLHHVVDLPHTLTQLRGLLAPTGQAILVDVAAPETLGADGLVPRSWFVEEAARTFGRDLEEALSTFEDDQAAALRLLGEAAERLTLSLEPAWLAHVTTDKLLPPAQFDKVYLGAFPGGVITQIRNLRAIHWQAAKDAAG